MKSSRYTIELPVVQEPRSYKTMVEEMTPAITVEGVPQCITIFKVGRDSRKGLRSAVHRLAKYFRKEFRYDFVQYSLENDDATVYLFTIHEYYGYEAFGACCFRPRVTTYPDSDVKETRWWMDWVWFHPYFRDRGVMSKMLERFKADHPYFIMEGPLSKASEAFANKHNIHPRFIGTRPLATLTAFKQAHFYLSPLNPP